MRWGPEQRQNHIASLCVDPGHFNRKNICDFYRVSIPQASADIREFLRLNPGKAVYNKRTKRYEATDSRGTMHCPICMRDSPHTHDMAGRWIGVDFDGTLSIDRFGRKDPYEVGEPIAAMVARVKSWLTSGYDVRLLTARMNPYSNTSGRDRDVKVMKHVLEHWCELHIGKRLPVTNAKDGGMEVLWDDRAVRVIRDTGMPSELYRAVSDGGESHEPTAE